MRTMSNNPLYPALEELFGNLNFLRGLLFVLENRFNNYIKQVNENKINPIHLLAGSSLVIRKLTEFPKRGFKYYPTGRFVAKGKKYLETFNILIERESAWTISQAYERFESFLFDIDSVFLANNTKFVKVEEKKSSIKNLILKFYPNNPQLNKEEWRFILKRCCRNNVDLLKKIQKWIPNFKNVIENNNRGINLILWYSVFAKVRDAITHSNLIIKKGIVQNYLQSQERKAILKEYFPGKQISVGYKINLSKEKTEINLRIIGELALEIFNNLSTEANYDNKIEWEK